MAHDFYARIMHDTDDSTNFPNFPKHQLFALLREMARGYLSVDRVLEKLKCQLDDELLHAYVNYIMVSSLAQSERVDRVNILDDMHLIHEFNDIKLPIKDLYPDKDSLRQRIGI